MIYALFRSYVKNRLVSKAVPPDEMAGTRLPHPPGSERSFRRPTSVQNRRPNWAAGFCAQIQFFIDKNPCQCYAIFDKNNCHFDLDHCQERG